MRSTEKNAYRKRDIEKGLPQQRLCYVTNKGTSAGFLPPTLKTGNHSEGLVLSVFAIAFLLHKLFSELFLEQSCQPVRFVFPGELKEAHGSASRLNHDNVFPNVSLSLF